MASANISEKLKTLPKCPGVYFYKDESGETIYIGKAANLRNRVRQYFQKSRARDPKTTALVSDIYDLDWIEVETELDALLLEAEMVRRYLPQYNILLRDDRSLEYIRIDIKSDHPTVTTVRRPLDDGAEYLGPYLNGFAVRRALKYLRRAFPYSTKKMPSQKRATLHYHLGLDPGLEEGKTSLEDYRKNLKKLIRYLKGQRKSLINEIERDMKKASKDQNFEVALKLRNQLFSLKALDRKVIFSDREFMDISKDKGLLGLAELLELSAPPKRIEAFDISHMSGAHNVASMVVFTSGVPDKSNYRKFKLRHPGNNDFLHMREALSRRLSQKNQKSWGLPDLFLIDGGKGQLSSALEVLGQNSFNVRAIGLAKRDEEIIIYKSNGYNEQNITKHHGLITSNSDDYLSVLLPKNSDIVKLLQRIRDESHRFAVSYHSSLKRSAQTKSLLDNIPGVGPATRKKLIKAFGSYKGVKQSSLSEIAIIVGDKKAKIIVDNLK